MSTDMSKNRPTNEDKRRQFIQQLSRELSRTASLLEPLRERFGDEVVEVVRDAVRNRTLHAFREVAEREESNQIEDLYRVLWEPMNDAGMEYTTEEKDGGLRFRCTRCVFHDAAKELGLEEWALHLYCSTDPHIAAGFNPRMGFKRTKTLMEGHDCCDHFYYMKDDDEE
jgi:predicted ArsR family transcriptional regulator